MLFKQEILLTYLQYIKLNVGDYTKKKLFLIIHEGNISNKNGELK